MLAFAVAFVDQAPAIHPKKGGTVPDMLNIYNILTNIGHRFGHQSNLDESSGRVSTIFCMELRSACI